MPVLMWIDSLSEWGNLIGARVYIRARRLFLQISSLISVLVVLLWLALFMYGSFHYVYMPAVLHLRDVNFVFRTDCDSEKFCSFPSDNVSLVTGHQPQLLLRGQKYVIVLELEMPESLTNQQLGLFIASIQLISYKGEVVQKSSRAAMLHYKSALYQTLETLFRLPSLLLSTDEQKQTVTVEFFNNYVENPYKPTLAAYIELQTKKIDLYRAILKIHAKFVGLRHLIFYWPVLSAVLGVATNIFFLSIVALMTWYRFAVNRNFGLDPTAQQSGSMGQGDGTQRSSVRRSMDPTRQAWRHSRQRSQQLAVVTSSTASGNVTPDAGTCTETPSPIGDPQEGQTSGGKTPTDETETLVEGIGTVNESSERDSEGEAVEASYVRHRQATVATNVE